MKKTLLAVSTLALIMMNQSALFAMDLTTLTDNQLIDNVTNAVSYQNWADGKADNLKKLQDLLAEINRRDPIKPYRIKFNPKALTGKTIDWDMVFYFYNRGYVSKQEAEEREALIINLVERGIPTNIRTQYGISVLQFASIAETDTTMPNLLKKLLKLGVDPNLIDNNRSKTEREVRRSSLESYLNRIKNNPEDTKEILADFDKRNRFNHFPWNMLPEGNSIGTKARFIATAVVSIGLSTGLYRWWTSNQSAQQKQNVLINNTGTDIFIRGSQDAVAAHATYSLPESGIIFIKLNKDQDDIKDLKIDMADYADDLQDSYLNLSIRKKWFSNWFTVPLFASEHWVDKE